MEIRRPEKKIKEMMTDHFHDFTSMFAKLSDLVELDPLED